MQKEPAPILVDYTIKSLNDFYLLVSRSDAREKRVTKPTWYTRWLSISLSSVKVFCFSGTTKKIKSSSFGWSCFARSLSRMHATGNNVKINMGTASRIWVTTELFIYCRHFWNMHLIFKMVKSYRNADFTVCDLPKAQGIYARSRIITQEYLVANLGLRSDTWNQISRKATSFPSPFPGNLSNNSKWVRSDILKYLENSLA